MPAPLSPDHDLVRTLRDLHRPEGRRQQQALLVEGRRAIDGFLSAGWQADLVLHPADETPPVAWPAARPVSARAAARLSQATTPSGWFARFPLPPPAILDRAAGGLALAGVADPGNAGTLLRAAAAFGIRQIAIIGGADPWGHKVVQASAGALATLAVHTPATLAELAGGAPLCALVARSGVAPEVLPAGPRWIVVGGEAHGLSATELANCSEHTTLPMSGAIESLNAAIAGAIVCYLLRSAR